MDSEVRLRREPTVFPTYEPAAPDPNPMFLEKRVYQGSSGRVYPLPFIDRIAEQPVDRAWDAIYLDNGLIEVMMLPEIGGRIHAGRDLSNGYDFFYRQEVIKPALVGLAGPWASGGVEFNWPQHHRPSTFMPTNVEIEHGDDGSITVWMGEHEPMDRTKGMHGVCLHPGRSVIELKVRLYNRTPYVQTFLWWSNIATHVHQGYKSFFPPDAHLVADHAKRALSRYPLADGHYYGVDYGERGREGVPQDEWPQHFVPKNQGGAGPDYPPNDLSWYANIPVPTSYMCMGTKDDFLGGYDHFAQAGLLHLADGQIAPGKKQWTWGNHEFGYAWDRNLTDADGPYIELMAGVYTDNQPDFSWIGPGETRTFSQFYYPYQAIGPVQFANLDVAISISGNRAGVAVTRSMPGASVAVVMPGLTSVFTVDLAPDQPFLRNFDEAPTGVYVNSGEGPLIASYHVEDSAAPQEAAVATEPPLPAEIASSDELFLTGQHLAQYRHATRDAAEYWREALRRDEGDVRCNNALGLWHLKRGEFAVAEERFRKAIARATHRNPNPADGEPYYNHGLALRFLDRHDEAVAAFAKAAWNAAWQSPAHLALAEASCRKLNWERALHHLELCLRVDVENLRARDLKAIVLRHLGRDEAADELLRETVILDPLDFHARFLLGQSPTIDNNLRIDLAIDLMRAGLYEPALEILDGANTRVADGTAPMVRYTRGYVLLQAGDERGAIVELRAAAMTPANYCFPARLEDILFLEAAIAANPEDARAPYYLGNLLYDRRRHREAIERWETAAHLEPGNAIAHRNLGIAAFNVLGDPGRARAAYHAALLAAPHDARLLYERDQLWKRVGVGPEERIGELRERIDLVLRRDDLTIEFCTLLNAVGRPEEAEAILDARKFQPWEGGEGMALGIFTRTHLALGRRALMGGDALLAQSHFARILTPPENLSEAWHLLANASDVWLAMGDALAALDDPSAAQGFWNRAASFQGDFQEMSVRAFSDLTYFQAIALNRLGRNEEGQQVLEGLDGYAREFARTTAKIDYFATSLPTMLLFDDDLQLRQDNAARFMQAQAAAGLGRTEEAKTLLDRVLQVDPNHARAVDLRAELFSRGER